MRHSETRTLLTRRTELGPDSGFTIRFMRIYFNAQRAASVRYRSKLDLVGLHLNQARSGTAMKSMVEPG